MVGFSPRIVTVLLLCATAAVAQKKDDGPPVLVPDRYKNTAPKPLPAKPKPPATTLLLNCDVACKFTVDGEAHGHLQADGAVKLNVGPGQHLVVATTDDDLDTVRETVEVKGAGQTAYMVNLKAKRDARLSGGGPLQAAQNFAQGKRLVEARQYTDAKPLLEQACNGNNAGGCSWLGRLYADGLGVSRDYELARVLFQKGCTGGAMRGCVGMGYLYENGYGVTLDHVRAMQYFQQSCNGGEMRGCFNLGNCYQHGSAGAADPVRASQYYQKACDGNDTDACNNLGVNYINGYGVQKNKPLAQQYFNKACAAGSAKGCENMKQFK